jgi:hypothetical protein
MADGAADTNGADSASNSLNSCLALADRLGVIACENCLASLQYWELDEPEKWGTVLDVLAVPAERAAVDVVVAGLADFLLEHPATRTKPNDTTATPTSRPMVGEDSVGAVRLTLWLDPGPPWTRLVELARQAEAAGWDAVRVGDSPGDRPELECWALMGALAAAVPRLRLDAVVGDDRGRHPAVVAKQACTVDQLSGGRVLLGLRPAPGPDGEARLAESCEVIRRLTAKNRSTFSGEYYQLADAPMEPKPVQRPFPIMLVGAGAALAARHGDHWSITGSPKAVRAQLTALYAACVAQDRDRTEISVSAWSDGTTEFLEYTATGIDEWVVPAIALDGPESLVRLRTETVEAG